MAGIKETTEAINGLSAVACELTLAAKDGFGLGDLVALSTNGALISKLTSAGIGIQAVPAELKDLDDAEIEALVTCVAANASAQLVALGLSPTSKAAVVIKMLPKAAALIQQNIAFALEIKAALDQANKAA
jgi:hypothetical protein